jgi:hypothetical protein
MALFLMGDWEPTDMGEGKRTEQGRQRICEEKKEKNERA